MPIPNWTTTYFSAPALDAWQRAQTEEITLAEVAFLEQALLLAGAPKRLLDVPCGEARHAVELAKLGHRLTGIDIAPENQARALARATKAGVTIEHVVGDMRALPAEPAGPAFDGAYCWGNSFGYFPRAETQRFAAAVAGCLRSGARFIIDTATAAESLLVELNQRSWIPVDDELTLLLECGYDARESRLDTTYISVRNDRVVDRRTAHHFVFTSGEIVGMLDAAGFETLGLLADLDGSEYELGSERLLVIAERR
ncbi:MAG TPA: class I SAM-dependent methyltransferase [Polyangiales bacterium]|nr:class I SAM-dependent methyltransferase [Polyangiales bacterium]